MPAGGTQQVSGRTSMTMMGCFHISEVLAFPLIKMFGKGGGRAELEAGSPNKRFWLQSKGEVWLGDSSGGVGSDWVLALLEERATRICHALGLPACEA